MTNKTKNNINFDQKVNRKTISLRTKITPINPDQPSSCINDYYKLNNHLYSRFRIVLHTNGCSYGLCTMCPIPSEATDPNTIKITAENYIRQIKTALKKYNNQEIISIYCGSFFCDNEIPQEARQKILHLVKKTKCNYLIVAAHPTFVIQKKLKEAYDILGDRVKIIIALGLQSANDVIRSTCVRTSLTKKTFLKAHKIIQEYDYITKSYILLKPPFLLQDEGIRDTVETITWLYDNDITNDITLCPMRITKGTVVNDLFNKKLYSQPKLATLVECLRQIQQKKLSIRLSLSNCDTPELETIVFSGCKDCEEKTRHAFRNYNNMVPVDFEKFRCQYCLDEERRLDPKEFYNLSFQERVAYWLALTEKDQR